MKKSNTLKTALAALALVAAPLTYNAVMAQQSGTTSVVQQAVDYSKTFVQKLAGALGVDQAKLETALKTASNGTVDEMLKNQDITRSQADQLKAQVAAGNSPFFGSERFDRRGDFGGRGPGGMGRGDPRDGGRGGAGGMMGKPRGMMDINISQVSLLESAAKALNLSIVQLDTQLRAGQTLTSLATIQKVNLETVKKAVTDNLKTQLAASVKAGTITQAMADEILARAQTEANFGLMGGRGGRR